MKKYTVAFLVLNAIFSIFLVIIKINIDPCRTCGNIMGISQLELSVAALVGSILILGLYWFSPHNNILLWSARLTSLCYASVASVLGGIQYQLGKIICTPCFISELFFYTIFVLFIIEEIVMRKAIHRTA